MAEPEFSQVVAFFPKSYQSDTRYDFEEHQADAIIRAATHQEHFYQHQMTVRFKADEQKAITLTIATPFASSSAADNGTLDDLPLSIVQDIILLCDIQSVFRLRQTSRRTREKVDSIWQYQKATEYGLDLFRASLMANVACNILLVDFYELLVTIPCSFCGYTARYVHMLTWKRVCRGCLKDAPEVNYVDKSKLKSKIKITDDEMAQLKVFKTPPFLALNRYLYLDYELVSTSEAMKVVGKPRDRYIEETFGEENTQDDLTTCVVPHLDKQGMRLNNWLSCEGCKQIKHPTYQRNKETLMQSAIEWRVYDRDGFLEHFRWCKQAQIVWEQKKKLEAE
ncbi:F-box domain-containing protein [Fusarium acuminatum]|uniref:F-box domain-containing protein n=1 Tax=Fusarium acuminatum TaxID=5515 RepID=A0ABZ2X934_9HYPO